MSLKPFLRPLPLIGLSASTLILASTLTTKTTPLTTSPKMSSPSWPVKPYQPRHTKWPYTPSDFLTQDPSPDTTFYSSPRFVTHIDDSAISRLKAYYSTTLPHSGKILDFCSSWISHYPPEIESLAESQEAPPLKIIGLGLNSAELEANPVLNSGRIVHDLNSSPDISSVLVSKGCVRPSQPAAGGKPDLLSAATNVVSIDYLTRPVEVLASLRSVTEVGGKVHLVISNRCFPTKAVGRWLRVGEGERLMMVGDYLHFAGWKNIEIVDLSESDEGTEGGTGTAEGGLRALMRTMGMGGGGDPLWVVRGVNEG